MNINKQISIILILVSILISVIGVAIYFYFEKEEIKTKNEEIMAVYIIKEKIPKNHKITKNDLLVANIAKKYILNTPLLKKEIVGKYTKQPLYKHDFIRKEILSNEPIIKRSKEIIIKPSKYSNYNMFFNMFKNPNYSLKVGDKIDIISVYSKEEFKNKTNSLNNEVKYVAENINILGFLKEGFESKIPIERKKIKRKIKKKEIEEEVILKAEELILDIEKKVLLKLIDDYNKGHQLWMVKRTKNDKEEIKKEEKIKSKIEKKDIKKSYTYKMYKIKNKKKTLKVNIYFEDEKKPSLTKKEYIKTTNIDKCLNNNKYLIGLSNKVHLRRGSSNKYKIVKILEKNTIIPYEKRVSKNWHLTCDGLYVHTYEANKISNKKVKGLLK